MSTTLSRGDAAGIGPSWLPAAHGRKESMDGLESITTSVNAESAESSPVLLADPYLKISQSEINEFLDCRRKWWLHHVEGWARPDAYTGPLPLGTNIHEVLCNYYSPDGTKHTAMELLYSIYNQSLQACGEYDYEDVQKDFELAVIMCEGYFEWLEETGADQFLEAIEPEVELHYDTEIKGKHVRIMGKRDIIARDVRTDMVVLEDHKTCQSFDDPMMDLNPQVRMYLLLQRLNGSTVVQNALWNLLRKVKRTARAKPPFYKREELYVSEEELRRYYERVTGIIGDIIDIRERLAAGERHYSVVYPRPSRDCSWKCPYRVVCPMIDSDPIGAQQFLEDNYERKNPYARYADEKGTT